MINRIHSLTKATTFRRFIQTKTIARTFTSPGEIFEFYEDHPTLTVTQLEPLLSQVGFIQTSKKIDASEAGIIFTDERFLRLLVQAASDIESCDSNTLSRFAQALSNLSIPKGGSNEVSELARRIAEVSCNRPNAFSPSTLTTLAFGLGTRGVSDPQFVEFVKIESLKMMQDFSPENAILLLESFRRMNVFNRELTDNIVERLTDEVDRFTARDIVNSIVVFSKLSLGRGFLLRRLSKLSFENLSLFTPSQVVKLYGGFARLRFLTSDGIGEVFSFLEPHLPSLSPNQMAEILFSTAMSSYGNESPLVVRMASAVMAAGPEKMSLTAQVDTVWALITMGSDDREGLKNFLEKICSISPPSNRAILLKMLEVTNAVAIEYPGLVKKDVVGAQWKSAMDDAEKFELNRFENARLHSEVLALVEGIKPDETGILLDKITLQRASQVGGLYRVDFHDESKNLIIDIDTLARPTSLVLKHRNLMSEGVAVVGLNYWEIRRFKSFEEQQVFLKSKIKKAINRAITHS